MTTYRLPSLQKAPGSRPGRGGTKRGYAVALNPAFPLIQPVSSLLTSIAKEHGLSVESDVLPHEAALAPPHDRTDIFRLFGSRVRTKLLITLACLKGRARCSVLYHAVPAESPLSAKTMIYKCIADGILESGRPAATV
jgi:hypothetical protein